jgi:hypothetical protein
LRLAAIVAVLYAISAGAPSALGQQAVDLASVSGRVTDQSGAVVTDAQVTARQTQTNVTTTTTTDQEGRFRLPYAVVGRSHSRGTINRVNSAAIPLLPRAHGSEMRGAMLAA